MEALLNFIAEGEGPEMPSISEFLPPAFLFEGTPFAFNRLDLIRVIVVLVMFIFFVGTAVRSAKRARGGNLVPTKPQAALEMILEFIKNFVYDALGEKNGKRWLPMATTICCSIFCLNITGIIPGLNMAATAGIGIPLLFGFWVFTAYWRQGIRGHGGGFKGFIVFVKSELFPPGLPFYVYPIYAIIEFAQLLVIKPLSLAIRLFANMMAGHILIALCYASTQYFIIVAAPEMKAIGAVTFIGAIFFTCFEALVAALQAYIFTLLMCAYISMSAGHDEEHNEMHNELPIETEAVLQDGQIEKAGITA